MELKHFGPSFFEKVAIGDFHIEYIGNSTNSIELAIWVGSLFVRTRVTTREIVRAAHGFNDALLPDAFIEGRISTICISRRLKNAALRHAIMRQAIRSYARHFGYFPHPGYWNQGTMEDIAHQYRKQRNWYWRFIPKKMPATIAAAGLQQMTNNGLICRGELLV